MRNSLHVYISGTQQGMVAMSHVNLKPGKVFKKFCVVAGVGMPEYVLNPKALKPGGVAYVLPAPGPIRGADIIVGLHLAREELGF